MAQHENTCRTLWMGAIQPTWNEQWIFNLFAHVGEVTQVKVIRNQHGFPSGYAFVEFRTHEKAQEVLHAFNGQPILGTNIVFRLNWGSGGVKKPTAKEYSLFVGDLSPEVTDPILLKAFKNQFSSTSSAKVITDANTGQSKGYGFVRFLNKEQSEQALAKMDGVAIGSRPIRVHPATAKKNDGGHHSMNHMPMVSPVNDQYANSNNTTVFVGNLDQTVSDKQLMDHFSEIGKVVSVKIPPGKSCGFVKFHDHSMAKDAIMKLNGSMIGNSAVRLDWGKSPANASFNMMQMSQMNSLSAAMGAMTMQPIGMGYPQYQMYPQPWQTQQAHPYAAIQYQQMYMQPTANAHFVQTNGFPTPQSEYIVQAPPSQTLSIPQQQPMAMVNPQLDDAQHEQKDEFIEGEHYSNNSTKLVTPNADKKVFYTKNTENTYAIH